MNTSQVAFLVLAVTVSLSAIAVACVVESLRLRKQINSMVAELTEKSPAAWIEALTDSKSHLQDKLSQGQASYSALSEAYQKAEAIVSEIRVGLTPPNFTLGDNEALKEAVRACRAEQYRLIKEQRATTSLAEWSWFGSSSDGAQLIRTYNLLMISAFNAEFDIVRSKMRYSSGDTAMKKLLASVQSLEKLAETVNVRISREYIAAKKKELKIWLDDLVRRQKEKEEARRQRELLRAQNRQLGRVSDDDDEDEEADGLDLQLAACGDELAKARALAAQMAGDELAELELKIAEIEEEKQRLEERFARAQSQAQITRAGYVYVISNVGSFGEAVCKIGMTRRLEPMDRVVELGDASVPYRFDVHTLAFVEDAPRVERSLHAQFNDRRVNVANHRKEFFWVEPWEVKASMEAMGVKSSWYFDREAKEYRESELLRRARDGAREARKTASETLPEAI